MTQPLTQSYFKGAHYRIARLSGTSPCVSGSCTWMAVTVLLIATQLSSCSVKSSRRGSEAVRAIGACTAPIDEHGLPAQVAVTWISRMDREERHALDRQCDTLGPVIVRAQPALATTRRAFDTDTLTIVNWNVHVGGGDIFELVNRLESGALTGMPVQHYVLLLQEAYRAEGGIPAIVEPGIGVPDRIAPTTKGRARQDIVSVARQLKLALYYVPSMRNGMGPPWEDRGNAIVSSLPLEEMTAIELPYTRQRRVAIGAGIRGHHISSAAWRLRLFVVHLDALAGPGRLWLFATGWRGSQADAVVEAVGHLEAAVLGADLNTWCLGRWESAWKRIAAVFPQTRSSWKADSSAHGQLDYIFFRLPPGWRSETRRLNNDFGSDHRPIVSVLRWNLAVPSD